MTFVIKGQNINIIDDFKSLGSYVGSTEHDVWIGLASTAFAKVKSIFISPMVKLNFKIRLFKAASISILVYGCESWILTEALVDKLDIFTRACYRIILGIKQSRNHVANESLHHLDQALISKNISERQLKFTGDCIRLPTRDPSYRFIIYESKIRWSFRPSTPKTTYLNEISFHILPKRSKPIKQERLRWINLNRDNFL